MGKWMETEQHVINASSTVVDMRLIGTGALIKQGWLMKRATGRGKWWKRRWFYFEAITKDGGAANPMNESPRCVHVLSYWADSADALESEPLGVMYTDGATI